MRVKFDVINKETGLKVLPGDMVEEIINFGFGHELQFGILEDGGLILTDEEGNWAFVDRDKFDIGRVIIMEGDEDG